MFYLFVKTLTNPGCRIITLSWNLFFKTTRVYQWISRENERRFPPYPVCEYIFIFCLFYNMGQMLFVYTFITIIILFCFYESVIREIVSINANYITYLVFSFFSFLLLHLCCRNDFHVERLMGSVLGRQHNNILLLFCSLLSKQGKCSACRAFLKFSISPAAAPVYSDRNGYAI